jgi:hypothetical protein
VGIRIVVLIVLGPVFVADGGVGEQDVVTIGFALTIIGHFGAGAPLISRGSKPIIPPTLYSWTGMTKLECVCRHSWLWLLSYDVSLGTSMEGNGWRRER